MDEIIEKLILAIKDDDTAKELEKFGITTEKIEGIKDLKIPKTLDEALTIRGVQSEYDKRLGKAANTREENLKSKYSFVEKEEEEKDEKEDVKSQDPAVQAILKELNSFKEKFENLEKEKAAQTIEQKKAKLTENLKSKGIPTIYVNAFDLDKDFDEQMEAVEEQFEADTGTILKDRKPGQKLPFPKKPEPKNEPSKAEVEAFKTKI